MSGSHAGHEHGGRRMFVRAAALLLAWAIAPGVSAQAEPDPVRELASTLPGRIASAHLRVLGVSVGEHSLDEVAAELGFAARFAPGGSDAVLAVCYAAGSGRGDVAVLFQAQRADADALVSLAHVTSRGALGGAARHCAPLPMLAGELSTEAGVGLGMSRTELLRRFAEPPSEQSARALGFYYYEPLDPVAGRRGQCQRLSGLRARLDAHGLRSFLVYRLRSGPGC